MDYVIIVAAGSGERLGADVPKALVVVAGRALVAWSVRAFDEADRFAGVVVAAPSGHVEEIRRALPPTSTTVTVVAGGATRQRSVQAGLAAIPGDARRVLVHDAARPLVSAELARAVLGKIPDAGGAIAAQPVADTIKRAGPEGLIAATVERAGLWRAETPQGFDAAMLRRVFDAADDAVLDTATDCASMVEAAGGRILLVDSASPNLKLTTPADAVIIEALLRTGAR